MATFHRTCTNQSKPSSTWFSGLIEDNEVLNILQKNYRSVGWNLPCGLTLDYLILIVQKYPFRVRIYLVQVQLRTEVLSTPSSTWSVFKIMTYWSWQYISCHWDTCSNHLAISNGLRSFQIHGLLDRQMHWQLLFLVQIWLRADLLCTPSLTRSGFELMVCNAAKFDGTSTHDWCCQ